MWHSRGVLVIMAGVLFVFAPGARADGLQLKNGNFVQGKYLGGTERAVQFGVNGRIRIYDIGDILSINFGSADAGLPSSNEEPKASSDTGLSFAAGNNVGMHAAMGNARKPGKIPAQPVAWRRAEGSGTRLRAEPQSSCAARTANSERNNHASANREQAEGILRPRFLIVSD